MPTRPLPGQTQMFKGTPTPTKTGGAGNQLTMMQGAIKRRINQRRPQDGPSRAVGGGPVPPGTKGLAPHTGQPAGSINKPPSKSGMLSTFVTENWQQKKPRY